MRDEYSWYRSQVARLAKLVNLLLIAKFAHEWGEKSRDSVISRQGTKIRMLINNAERLEKLLLGLASMVFYMAVLLAAYGVIIWICYDFWTAFIPFIMAGILVWFAVQSAKEVP